MSNNSYPEVISWLALIRESGLKLNLVKPIIQRWCINDKRALAELFNLSPLELASTFGLSEADTAQVMAVADKLESQAKILAQWQQQGIEPLIRTDPRYPQRLIHTLSPVKQPLVLWAQGATALLNRPTVTMLGTQDPDDDSTTEFINNLMATLEAQEIGLISGYGRGLDRTTFETMLNTENGRTVAVLPMGLHAFAKTTNKLQQAVNSSRTELVTPFSPDTPYQDNLAKARNILIDHLTLALLIPESDEHSLERAKAALERGLPVFVKANTPGNRQLLDHGALLLTDPEEVVEWVQQALVDDAMHEPEPIIEETQPEILSAAPLAATAPASVPPSNEDYSLRTEEIPPLDSEEALEVLSLGGEIPEILRNRLKKSQDDQ